VLRVAIWLETPVLRQSAKAGGPVLKWCRIPCSANLNSLLSRNYSLLIVNHKTQQIPMKRWDSRRLPTIFEVIFPKFPVFLPVFAEDGLETAFAPTASTTNQSSQTDVFRLWCESRTADMSSKFAQNPEIPETPQILGMIIG
jgi:hypothetical protein